MRKRWGDLDKDDCLRAIRPIINDESQLALLRELRRLKSQRVTASGRRSARAAARGAATSRRNKTRPTGA